MTAFNSSMLTLARESRGLTQSSLADASGISQPSMSKYEAGLQDPSHEHMVQLSATLGYSRSFFGISEEVIGTSCIFHRKRKRARVGELRTLHARINVFRLQIARLMKSITVETKNEISCLDPDEFDDGPLGVAQLVRHAWRVPPGPVRNLCHVIEHAGGVVFSFDFGTDHIDAVSQWDRDGLGPPFFFLNTRKPADRLRWSLAHELAHIVMHEIVGPNGEKEADEFAGEFLMPAEQIQPEMYAFSLRRAFLMKPVWRVSMQALVRRARRLGCISDSSYMQMFRSLSAQGYRTREPAPIDPEFPSVVSQAVNFHMDQLDYSLADVAKLLWISEHELVSAFLAVPGQSRFRVVEGGKGP